MRSLRRRLLVGTALGSAVVLSSAGLALYLTMSASLMSEFDTALGAKVATLAGLIEQDGARIELEFAEADMPEFKRSKRPEYYEVWLADGTVVASSPSLGGAEFVWIEVPLHETLIRAVVLPDGRSGRMAILHCAARPDGEHEVLGAARQLVVALARDVQDVEAALARLRLVLLLVGALATVASVAILAWQVGVGLKPIDRLAREIGRIDEQRLSVRFDPANSVRELAPVVSRLNDLLGRLEAAFAREKILTADVAHELRTPLAGLRSTLEVALSRERKSGDYRDALAQCLAICKQTQTMVVNLLALARLDAGNESFDCQQIDVERLLHDSWQPFQEAGVRRDLTVRWQLESLLKIESDPYKLRSVLTNAFENAVHYVNAGGDVAVKSGRRNGAVEISVANTGSRLSAEQVAHVFERFWRGDSAREKDGEHCGLGLPLCKTIVERLGGVINAESQGDGRFILTITLPSISMAQPNRIEAADAQQA